MHGRGSVRARNGRSRDDGGRSSGRSSRTTTGRRRTSCRVSRKGPTRYGARSRGRPWSDSKNGRAPAVTRRSKRAFVNRANSCGRNSRSRSGSSHRETGTETASSGNNDLNRGSSRANTGRGRGSGSATRGNRSGSEKSRSRTTTTRSSTFRYKKAGPTSGSGTWTWASSRTKGTAIRAERNRTIHRRSAKGAGDTNATGWRCRFCTTSMSVRFSGGA